RGVQVRNGRANIIAGGRTSVEDNQSRALLGQPARDDETETTHAADDEVAAVVAYQWLRRRGRDRFDAASDVAGAGYRDDDLAGVLTGRHEPKRVGRVVQAESGDGKHLQSAIRHVLQDVLQKLAIPCRLQLQIQVKVYDGEGRAFCQCRQSQVGIGVDVFLAQFDEPAAGGKYL